MNMNYEVLRYFNNWRYGKTLSELYDIRIMDGKDHIQVSGRFPLEVVKTIMEKYPNDEYDMKLSREHQISSPEVMAYDDQYIKDYMEINNQELSNEEKYYAYETAHEELEKRPADGKYIPNYYIGTIKGIVILLTELEDYTLRKIGKEEEEVARIDDYMSQLNHIKAEITKMTMSNYEWLEQYPASYQNYIDGIRREGQTELDYKMRQALEEFDQVVNPFMTDRLHPENYMDQNFIDHSNDKYQYWIITNSYRNEQVITYRHQKGFQYSYSMATAGKFKGFSAIHSYDAENGEILCFEFPGEDQQQKVIYHLTTGKVSINGLSYQEANENQKSSLYKNVLSSIARAKGLTLEKETQMQIGDSIEKEQAVQYKKTTAPKPGLKKVDI